MAKVLVNFQDEFLEEVDKIAQLEHRTRSSLIREALRRYLSSYNKTDSTNSQQNENFNNTKSLVPNKIIYPAAKAS